MFIQLWNMFQLLVVLILISIVNSSWTPRDALQEHNLRKVAVSQPKSQELNRQPKQINTQIISRQSNVKVTSDTRGNLGPASVIIQDPPGTDWLKDRWQAASDMGGTAIPGAHWVMLDFQASVSMQSIILDWETAYATNYRIEVGNNKDNDNDWTVLFDGNNADHTQYRKVEKSGQSPGVKYALPLHIVHTIELREINPNIDRIKFRYLRVFIVKPAAGWGVSLWQVDVIGSR